MREGFDQKTTMDLGFILILFTTQIIESQQEAYHKESQFDYYNRRKCPDIQICRYLNRQPCRETENHCGECSAGFTEGESGDCRKVTGTSETNAVPTDRDLESLGKIERQIDDLSQGNDGKNEKNNVVEPSTPRTERETTAKAHPHPSAPLKHVQPHNNRPVAPIHSGAAIGDALFLGIIAACSVAGLIGLIFAGVCWYRLQKNMKAAKEVEYPAYGITGPNKERVVSPDDRKLAQSAQMYHYQRQKQQMIALERASGEMKHDGSEEESDVENEEGDYTVYECPGLAPTGEMEVKNPLFNEDIPPSPPRDGPPPQ